MKKLGEILASAGLSLLASGRKRGNETHGFMFTSDQPDGWKVRAGDTLLIAETEWDTDAQTLTIWGRVRSDV